MTELQNRLLAKLRATRYSFGIWLVFSVLVAAASYYFYPEYHFLTDGGWQGWRLVCAIDFIMGPVLFFIVFWPGKPKNWLLLDIVILVSVQFIAMGWGLYKVLGQRPVADSYTMTGFQSLTIAPYERAGMPVQWMQRLSSRQVPMVYVRHPTLAEVPDLMHQISNGIPAAAQWKYLEPINAADSILNDSRYQNRFQGWLQSTSGQNIWQQWQKQHSGASLTSWRYALFIGRYRHAVLFFDPQSHYCGYVLLPADATLPVI